MNASRCPCCSGSSLHLWGAFTIERTWGEHRMTVQLYAAGKTWLRHRTPERLGFELAEGTTVVLVLKCAQCEPLVMLRTACTDSGGLVLELEQMPLKLEHLYFLLVKEKTV